MDSLATRLQQALKYRNMRKAKLAELSGIPKSAVSNYCAGFYEPLDDRLITMANVLGVNPDWLRGYDDVPMPSDSSEVVTRAQSNLTTTELTLLTTFSRASDRDKTLVKTILSEYLHIGEDF